MSFAFFQGIRPRSGPILSQCSFFLAVLWILQFCDTSKSSHYAFDFPLGSILTGNQTVLSENATFEAGLFSPLGSDLHYLGIWYVRINPRTVVWVANRNMPISGRASYGCSASGELQLRNSSGSVIWSSETTGRNVSGGVFTSTGNIMLLSESASKIVWQSFDYPADTWLPDMKLQPGKKLVSWKSASDPSEGPYSLQLLRNGEIVSMWKNRKQYWTSGAWNGHQFSGSAYKENTSSFQYFHNDSGSWWSMPLLEYTFFPRAVLDSNGLITLWGNYEGISESVPVWFQPQDQCLVYGFCGSNGVCRDDGTPLCSCPAGFQPVNAYEWSSNVWTSGCSLKGTLDCRGKASGNEFVPLQHTSFDAGWRQLEGLDPNECLEACLRNCSCSAYSYDGSSESCELLGGGLLNGWTSAGISGTVHVKVAVGGMIGLSGKGRQKMGGWAAMASVAAALLLVVGAAGAYVAIRRSAKARLSRTSALIKWFTYSQLQAGTRNFSERLGSGGFGVVFKGSLPGEGSGEAYAIAVKQLLPQVHQQGEKQFRMEVASIGSIQHVNLVRLRGFCAEKCHRLLVYDFMPNGSLDGFLSSAKTPPAAPNSAASRPLLDWATRYRVALGVARGIAYLHDGCRQCIIHCDIKPENILLDADFSAKVTDFGLAKFVGREFSRALTTIRGTRGYLAPEWIAGMAITPKADVYSFGMTVLELVSGRRNSEHNLEPSLVDSFSSSGSKATVDSATSSDLADPLRRFFPVWAALCIQEGRDLRSLVDRRLRGIVDYDQLRRVVVAAVWCIQDHEISRPTMRHVVHILEGLVDVNPPPIPESLRILFVEGDSWNIANR